MRTKLIIASALAALAILLGLFGDWVADSPEPQRSPAYQQGEQAGEILRDGGLVKPSEDQIDALAHGSGWKGSQVWEFKAGFEHGWRVAE